jgi:hypothetical protein
MLATKVAHLRLPAAIVAGIFMHEHDRRSGADRFDVKVHAVRRGDFAHCGYFDTPPRAMALRSIEG